MCITVKVPLSALLPVEDSATGMLYRSTALPLYRSTAALLPPAANSSPEK